MILILQFLISFLALTEAKLSVRSWQSLSDIPQASDFPEASLLKNKPNTAIAFTGGGSRAYVASMGILTALYELDLIKNIRYVAGISGGAWATTTFSYAQNVTDDVLLGSTLPPEQFSMDKLNEINPNSARALAVKNLTLIALNAYHNKEVDSIADAWCYGVSKTYLEPVGILQDKMFSWDADSVKDIVSRNKNFKQSDFQVPVNPNRPYPIIGTTLVGPTAGGPYSKNTQNYTLLEITPLYVGQFKTLDVDYKYTLLTHTARVGGAIEPYAFGRNGGAPLVGMSSKHSTALLNVPQPETPLDLRFAAGASSYAPGSLVESLRPKIINETWLNFDYWSPTNTIPVSRQSLFADGGAYENIPLISFLQRRVEKIALFFVSATPLAPSDKWNPYTDPYTGDEMTDCFTTFFGVIEKQANWENRSFEYEMNQVFSQTDFPVVVSALQAAQAKGNGIIATFNLTTIENKWWGIPAGLNVEITFSYLGRLKEWERRLPIDLKSYFIPKIDTEDLSNDISTGPFKGFPHYATLGGDVSYEKANALSDLTGWSVHQHADLFKQFFA